MQDRKAQKSKGASKAQISSQAELASQAGGASKTELDPNLTRQDLDLGNYLSPLPVTLVSSQKAGDRPNALTIAWNGIINSKPPMVSISLQRTRYSYQTIKETGEFVVNVPDLALAKALDYCGVKSYRDTDKFQDLGLHTEPMQGLDQAPAIVEAPLSLGCKLRNVHALGSHDIFLGEIISIRARASLIDDQGALRLEDAGLISYVHGEYFSLGDWLGFFGWSIAKEDVLKRRTQAARTREKKRKYGKLK